MTNPLENKIDPYKIINKLLEQNANMNLQLVSLSVALEEEIAKNLKGGASDGNTEQPSTNGKKA